MGTMPTTPLIVGLMALLALRPPMPRHSSPFNIQFALGWWINELPFWGLWWLLAGTVGALAHPDGRDPWWWLLAALTAVDVVVLARLAIRGRSARPVLSAALEEAFGPGAAQRPVRPPWWRIVLLPIVSWRPDVRRIRNRRYGPSRRGNRLDVYVSRRHVKPDAPVLVYLHGGAFVMGSKLLGARPLLHRLAAQGWVCISAGYRLRHAGYPDQLADARSVVSWVRANVADHGGDPDAIFLAGGSAGAHLAATTALSGAPVRGVIGCYGYYGPVGRSSDLAPTSPESWIHPAAPPFMIVHGALDTLVLASDAHRFAHRLRDVSRQAVVYAELPGAQHNFDFFHSVRADAVVDGIARFIELVVDGRSAPAAAEPPSVSRRP